MGQNFIPIERDQSFLLPPDVRDWLPADHEVWLLLAALDQLDLSGFYATYRADGHGRAAYDPAMMVGLLLWAYSDGVRSSRAVQRHCERDVAYRVVTGNQVPDHATIARFLARHRSLMEGLFAQVLGLCAEAGLVRVGVIALDGTKLRGNASPAANRDLAGLDAAIVAEVARILDQAQAVDAAEDARFGADRRGDEPPPGMAPRLSGWSGCARPRPGWPGGAPPSRPPRTSAAPTGSWPWHRAETPGGGPARTRHRAPEAAS